MTVRPVVKTNKKGIHVKISKQTDLRYSPPDLVSASSESPTMVAHGHKSTVSHLNEHFKDVPLQSLQQQQQ